jgi:hypothetical protein
MKKNEEIEPSQEVKKSSITPTKAIALGVAIILVVVAIVAIFISSSGGPATTGAAVTQPQQEVKTQAIPAKETVCRDTQVPYDYLEEYTDTVPYTKQVCETKDLIYRSTASGNQDGLQRDVKCIDSHQECKESHKTWLTGKEVCDRYETVCDTYRETTSFSITNLDTEKGQWGFEWQSHCRTNQPLCTSTTSEVQRVGWLYLDPTETKSDTHSIEYDAKGQKVLYIQFTHIPTKQVCRDVIDYKEVTKTRTVTRYRTEQVCE